MTENSPEPFIAEPQSIVDKPPPIIVQVESIAPEPITMGGGIELKNDWFRLLNSAPFQMYVCEVTGNSYGNVEEWIVPYVEDRILSEGEDKMFLEYSDWHSEKGCWKKETVYGDLIADGAI